MNSGRLCPETDDASGRRIPIGRSAFLGPPHSEVRGKRPSPQARPTDSASGLGASASFSPRFGGACGAASMGSVGVPLLLLVGALARIPKGEAGKETPAHFLHQAKSECHFLNGTQRVRFLERQFYDRQEIVRFDSDRGEYEAVTALGKEIAEIWNKDKQLLQYKKARVDSGCRPAYEVLHRAHVIGRRAKPTVSISSTKLDPASPHTILLCTARGFYPVEIEVHWLKNGRPEKEGVAFGEELQNGDWTYQLQVMLETQTQRGDLYTCQVEHISLEAPITIQWEPRSSKSARSKLWTGIMGGLIGVIFFATGLSLYLKSKTAIPIQPPAALMD